MNIGNRFEQVSDFLSAGYRTGCREVIENRRRYEAHVNAPIESAGDLPFTSSAFAEPWPPGWNGYAEALSAMLYLDGRPVQSPGSAASESVQSV